MCVGKIQCRITLCNPQTVLARKTGHLIQPAWQNVHSQARRTVRGQAPRPKYATPTGAEQHDSHGTRGINEQNDLRLSLHHGRLLNIPARCRLPLPGLKHSSSPGFYFSPYSPTLLHSQSDHAPKLATISLGPVHVLLRFAFSWPCSPPPSALRTGTQPRTTSIQL